MIIIIHIWMADQFNRRLVTLAEHAADHGLCSANNPCTICFRPAQDQVQQDTALMCILLITALVLRKALVTVYITVLHC